MTEAQKRSAQLVIRKVAMANGITPEECLAEIAVAIDHAWAVNDPHALKHRIDLIGDPHKPTPEELIYLISSKIT